MFCITKKFAWLLTVKFSQFRFWAGKKNSSQAILILRYLYRLVILSEIGQLCNTCRCDNEYKSGQRLIYLTEFCSSIPSVYVKLFKIKEMLLNWFRSYLLAMPRTSMAGLQSTVTALSLTGYKEEVRN